MKHRASAFLALALAMSFGSAVQASTWDVRYAGMPMIDGSDAPATLDVIFTGRDSNLDRVLTANELSDLKFVFHWDSTPDQNTVYPVYPIVHLSPCGPHPDCWSTLTAFSFSLASRSLTSIQAGGLLASDDFLDFNGSTADIYGRVYWDATQAQVSVTRVRPLQQVAQEVQVAAVPEPTTAALMGLGVLALGAGKARRRSAKVS